MRLYCACSVTTHRGLALTGEALDGVMLGTPMTVEKVGVPQFLADGSPHYPNVDIRGCPRCGCRVVVE